MAVEMAVTLEAVRNPGVDEGENMVMKQKIGFPSQCLEKREFMESCEVEISGIEAPRR